MPKQSIYCIIHKKRNAAQAESNEHQSDNTTINRFPKQIIYRWYLDIIAAHGFLESAITATDPGGTQSLVEIIN